MDKPSDKKNYKTNFQKVFNQTGEFLYNKKNHHICKRSVLSWIKLISFFTLLYLVTLMFGLFLYLIFIQMTNPERPYFDPQDSLIGTNFELSAVPKHPSTLSRDNFYHLAGKWKGETNSNDLDAAYEPGYVARLDYYFKKVITEGQDGSVECFGDDLNKPRVEPSQRPCRVIKSRFGDCANSPYGFRNENGTIQPCFILKLNKIFRYIPEPYKAEDELPKDFPPHLLKYVKNPDYPRKIFINCKGENIFDEEGMGPNPFQYFPEDQGVPMGFFPHKSVPHKPGGSVAIKFLSLPRNKLVHFECRTWFAGSLHREDSDEKRIGMFRFYILVE